MLTRYRCDLLTREGSSLQRQLPDSLLVPNFLVRCGVRCDGAEDEDWFEPH